MLVPKQLELQFLKLCKPWQQRSTERNANAQWQRVDEQAYHGFGAGQIRRPARGYTAEEYVGLSAIAREHQSPGRSKQRCLRERMATCKGIEGGRRGRIKFTDAACVIVIKNFARFEHVIVKRQWRPR